MNDDINLIGNKFDKNYITWKNWDINFLKLKKNQYQYYKAEILRTKSRFNAGSSVLEIGFGNGSFLNYSKQMGWKVIGTELNLDLVNLAKANGYDVYLSKNLSIFQDNSFDLIVAFDVLEHLSEDNLHDLIFNIKRILVSGGFFIARFPNGDSPFGLKIQNGDFTHVLSIGSGKISSLAAISNMKVIYIGGEAQPIVGTNFLNFIHKIFVRPIIFILNIVVGLIFFPREKVDFFSSNLTVIFKIEK
jgi:2-polyprenyl-3-methyl-5-hydroxy-6-metoxy-1,4-benzoquinol methylase